MKKQKIVYRYVPYQGITIHARKEIPFELQLSSRLLLDEICFNWNKERLERAINTSIDAGNKEVFLALSEQYRQYIWE
ncbi:IDEAL domain-containing protein [Virgibacillus siamensis]|uniref:IDEAL domain-containing protein n=1 Tax=Virgibacillus siamensis TaxID=480071 RepID=UPI0009858A1F|nr:IDEAL domain-containing protein [Virgibacillus siamensis]